MNGGVPASLVLPLPQMNFAGASNLKTLISTLTIISNAAFCLFMDASNWQCACTPDCVCRYLFVDLLLIGYVLFDLIMFYWRFLFEILLFVLTLQTVNQKAVHMNMVRLSIQQVKKFTT